MIGQISASNQLRASSEYVRSQLRTSYSVMEFGFKLSLPTTMCHPSTPCHLPSPR